MVHLWPLGNCAVSLVIIITINNLQQQRLQFWCSQSKCKGKASIVGDQCRSLFLGRQTASDKSCIYMKYSLWDPRLPSQFHHPLTVINLYYPVMEARVWTTCLRFLAESGTAGAQRSNRRPFEMQVQRHNQYITRPKPKKVKHVKVKTEPVSVAEAVHGSTAVAFTQHSNDKTIL